MIKFKIIITLPIILMLVFIGMFADFKIVVLTESDLPYSLSPLNYSNSSLNYKNSINNYKNSSFKLSNLSSKYENSPFKLENGENGDRRLLVEQNGSFYFVGYYVFGDDGLINYFSSNGKRLFFKPLGTNALFDGESGDFCGGVATIKDEDVLILTEKGELSFLKDGVSLSNESGYQPKINKGNYPGGSKGHWIQKNEDFGSIIILEDNSIWQVNPIDKVYSGIWLPISNITVVESKKEIPGFDYILINTDEGEKVIVKYLGKK